LTKTIVGIDAAKVDELMTSKAAAYQQAMDADASEGATMGVGGTPSFLIGKQMIVGAQPYDQSRRPSTACWRPNRSWRVAARGHRLIGDPGRGSLQGIAMLLQCLRRSSALKAI